jgi:chromosome segregation ATPase
MKKSQINSTEEKVSAHQNEIARLHEEIKFLRHNLEQSRDTLSTRDKDVARLQGEHKSLETKFIKQEMEMKEYTIKLENRAQQSRHREKDVAEREGLIKKLQSEMEEFKFLFTTRGQELQRYVDEINKLKSELSDLYNLSDSQKMEIRKLKRRPVAQSVLCESCKIK